MPNMNIGSSSKNVDVVITGSLQTNKLKAPSTSGGSTYSVGSNGQILRSNGTTVYWSNMPSGVPSGGTNGQVLKMVSNAAAWATDDLGVDVDLTGAASGLNTTSIDADSLGGRTAAEWAELIGEGGGGNVDESQLEGLVHKTGDTMTGDLTVNKASPSIKVTNGTVTTRLGIGSGGVNRGIHDTTLGKWLIYCDGTDAKTQLKLYGAVWNDYAEFRKSDVIEPGRVVVENGDGSLSISTERLQRGAEIVSDTFGFAIGETEECKTPIAVSGRVLAYYSGDISEFKPGYPVCSGPNGTVSIMTDEEEEKYPSRIIGTVSEIPAYEVWGSGNVEVKNRIWIRIR